MSAGTAARPSGEGQHALVPTIDEEAALLRGGLSCVAGVDEAGRGPIAGPVVAAAVLLTPADLERDWWAPLRDSKLLTPEQRDGLALRIRDCAAGVSVGMVSHEEIDATGIVPATRRAMTMAVQGLPQPPGYVLIDGRERVYGPWPQKAIIDGDALVVSIAAASIIAKVYRDCLMQELEQQYPGWGFGRHKGYCTRQHLEALQRLGASPIHRRSFAPISQLTLDLRIDRPPPELSTEP